MPVTPIFSSHIGRICGAPSAALSISQAGIRFQSQGQMIDLSWRSLIAPPQWHLSLFGWIIQLPCADKTWQIAMVSYGAEQTYLQPMLTFWLQAQRQPLLKFVEHLRPSLSQQYPRNSHLQRLHEYARQEQNKWQLADIAIKNSRLVIDEPLALAIQELLTIAAWTRADRQAEQERFVTSQLSQFQSLFDSIESRPLTLSQRRACIIDEHNNLLLAGAGSGKTSVMVGRSAYLLASGQAQAEDLLLLAFGRDAANELSMRIQDKLKGAAVLATTFHSLGLSIIQQVEGQAPSLSPWQQDNQGLHDWVKAELANLMQDPAYSFQVQEYFERWHLLEKHPHDFASRASHHNYLNEQQIVSLKGDKVANFSERVLANWLFSRQIDYHYQAAHKNELSRFHLPQLGLYLHFFSLDKAKRSPEYVDNAHYQGQIATTINGYKEQQTPHIDLYYYQAQQGQLLPALIKALARLGIEPSAIPANHWLRDSQLAQPLMAQLARQLAGQIGLFKLHQLDDSKAKARWLKRLGQGTNKAPLLAELELLQPLVSRYQAHLKQANQIDFDDMIIRACQYVTSGQFVSPWRFIMVDEFQDISAPRAQLILALRNSVKSSSLFCVGDDWQAIYRFAGSDVNYTRQFSAQFGDSSINHLDTSFRFNERIAAVASNFVQTNPQQIAKSIQCLSKGKTSAVSLISAPHIQQQSLEIITKLLAQHASAVKDGGHSTIGKMAPRSVLILSRFRFHLPSAAQLKKWQQEWPNLTISAMTIHASKGMEADIVIISPLISGQFGLPARQVTPLLLDALLPPKEAYPFAEERRLLYVALTRAKEQVYLLSDSEQTSEFIAELALKKMPL
ncbi:UvrD-helicase domain-containing protein [Shewanella sp. SNU WT4]|uniref:UvrD-helicase domain-containing protein n=1 Tax=Shewanella sp. SNU WT4 TaxID=2590015 RepID=UPI00143DC9E0|nr:UvrD-helicase domain-containing protein [Shewanella sp. SNU WT4]